MLVWAFACGVLFCGMMLAVAIGQESGQIKALDQVRVPSRCPVYFLVPCELRRGTCVHHRAAAAAVAATALKLLTGSRLVQICQFAAPGPCDVPPGLQDPHPFHGQCEFAEAAEGQGDDQGGEGQGEGEGGEGEGGGSEHHHYNIDMSNVLSTAGSYDTVTVHTRQPTF